MAGGILALMSLTGANWSGPRGHLLVTIGLFGAALNYGDGIHHPRYLVAKCAGGFQLRDLTTGSTGDERRRTHHSV